MTGFAKFLTCIIDWFYFSAYRRIIPLQTFRYAACGALNVAFSFLLYYLVLHYLVQRNTIDLGFFVLSPHVASQMIVFPVITYTGFMLNRYVAFKNSPLRRRTQSIRYILSTIGSWVINVAFLKLFVDVLGFWDTPAFMLATLIVIPLSYLMQKYFTFRGCVEI